jgi:hypothetical protein
VGQTGGAAIAQTTEAAGPRGGGLPLKWAGKDSTPVVCINRRY